MSETIDDLKYENTEGEVRFRPNIQEIKITNNVEENLFFNEEVNNIINIQEPEEKKIYTNYSGNTIPDIKSNHRIIKNNTSQLKSGGIYYITNNEDDDNKITLSSDNINNNISIILPKVSINLLCQRKYNDGRAPATIADNLKSEPNKLNMNGEDFPNLNNLKEDIEHFSGLHYEFILINDLDSNGKIEICTLGHNHDNDLSNIPAEKRPIIGAYPAFRAQISNATLSNDFDDTTGNRGRAGGVGSVANITGTANPEDKRVRIPDKPISNGNDMFGYVLTKTKKDLFKDNGDDINIPQLLSSPDMTDVGDLYFNNRPDTHHVDVGVLRAELEANYGNGNGDIEGLFKKETFIYGDGAFPVGKTYENFHADGKNYDLGNSRGFSKKILFCGTAKKGDRITCLHNGLHWYVEAHTSSNESFKRNNNTDYSANLSTMVTRRVADAGNNFGQAIVTGQNRNRLQLEKGLKEHTGGIIYY